MNPVVGLDVAKGESQVQAFLDQSKPYGKSFSMKHIKEELEHFLEFLKEIEGVPFGRPKAQVTEEFKEVYDLWKAGEITAVKAMSELGVKKTSFYKLVKEYENDFKKIIL